MISSLIKPGREEASTRSAGFRLPPLRPVLRLFEDEEELRVLVGLKRPEMGRELYLLIYERLNRERNM